MQVYDRNIRFTHQADLNFDAHIDRSPQGVKELILTQTPGQPTNSTTPYLTTHAAMLATVARRAISATTRVYPPIMPSTTTTPTAARRGLAGVRWVPTIFAMVCIGSSQNRRGTEQSNTFRAGINMRPRRLWRLCLQAQPDRDILITKCRFREARRGTKEEVDCPDGCVWGQVQFGRH